MEKTENKSNRRKGGDQKVNKFDNMKGLKEKKLCSAVAMQRSRDGICVVW
jgi:hypothetical protein